MTTNSPIDVTREITRAFEQFYKPSLKRDLRRRAASEDGYGAFELSMCAGWVSDYRDIFDFFVNLPGTTKPQKPQTCSWRLLEPNITIDKFLEMRASPLRLLLDLAGAQERIQVGYVVSYEHGRVDEITTWSRLKLLFATERSFVYIDSYDTTIH